jgi:hypothetical protein
VSHEDLLGKMAAVESSQCRACSVPGVWGTEEGRIGGAK